MTIAGNQHTWNNFEHPPPPLSHSLFLKGNGPGKVDFLSHLIYFCDALSCTMNFSVLQLQNILVLHCKWYILGVVNLSVPLGLFSLMSRDYFIKKFNRPLLLFVFAFGLEIKAGYHYCYAS